MLLVRAQLTLADDRSLDGFVTPQHEADPESLGIMQPSVFLPSGIRCDFWDGMYKRPEERRKSLYAEMGDDPARIFPIRFRAEEGLATGRVAGSIPGFCWCPKDRVQVYY